MGSLCPSEILFPPVNSAQDSAGGGGQWKELWTQSGDWAFPPFGCMNLHKSKTSPRLLCSHLGNENRLAVISGGPATLLACDMILSLVTSDPKHNGLKTGEWEIWNELL